jgi:hypothetical protein
MKREKLIEIIREYCSYNKAGNLYGLRIDQLTDRILSELPAPQPVTEDDMSGLILEWQKHNRDNGLSWNEVAELGRQIKLSQRGILLIIVTPLKCLKLRLIPKKMK